MPRLASARQVAELQRRTEAFFYGATAIYYAPPDPENDLDEYGQPDRDSKGETISCSFTDKPDKETWKDIDYQNASGEIRFNENLVPSKGGEFQIEGQFDELTGRAKRFEIIDIRDRGGFGFVCLLKAVSV